MSLTKVCITNEIATKIICDLSRPQEPVKKHFSKKQLKNYAYGTMPKDLQKKVDAHFNICPECLQIAEENFAEYMKRKKQYSWN
ncbi:MAG: hypothetical protein HYY52_06560 [Candidatus Melainabacteria bacterium]|nr:hypothetical protein [Candidatus Melainabacteria bacterium]